MEVHTDRGEGGREGGGCWTGEEWRGRGEGGGTAVPVVCDGNKYPTAALGFIYAPCHATPTRG